MRIVVTGATGYIGRHLVQALLTRGHEVVAVARSMERFQTMPWHKDVIFNSLDIFDKDAGSSLPAHDLLIHLAWPGLPNYCELFHIEHNFSLDYNFLSSAVRAGTPRVMVAGTCFEYGSQNGCLSEDVLTQPNNPYGMAKDVQRKFLEMLQKKIPFGLQWVRLFYVYGPGQNPKSLLAQLDRAIASGDKVFRMSGGEQLRDYLHVEEVAKRLAAVAEMPECSGIVNCCSGKPISVRRIVEERIKFHGADIDLDLGYYPYLSYEPMAFWGDSSKIDAHLATWEDRNTAAADAGSIGLASGGERQLAAADNAVANGGISVPAVVENAARIATPDPESRIYYTKPSITEKEVAFVTDAARVGWGKRCYEYIDRFEAMFREHVGSRFAISTSSCTGAMHMGLAALGIGPGDEVIIADANWIASAAPIVYMGAKPVFVDILPDSWCVDPAKVEAAITEKTKAIVAVHLYGNLCDMDRLLAIGKKYGLPVIEDAAEAIGSIYGTRRAGSLGSFGVFSFHGTKTLTTGEGGMFVTDDEDLYNRVLTLSNHGRRSGQTKLFWPDMVGYKYKMSNVQAAIGCAQMERIDELIARKREIFKWYRDRFAGFSEIAMNPAPSVGQNGYWMPTLVFSKESGISRERIIEQFQASNIDARVFFWPLSSLSFFEPVLDNVVAYDIPGRAINLPSYHELNEGELERVACVVRSVLSKGKGS